MKLFITITAIVIFITGCCCPSGGSSYSGYSNYRYGEFQDCYNRCDYNYLRCRNKESNKRLCKTVFDICVHNCTVE